MIVENGHSEQELHAQRRQIDMQDTPLRIILQTTLPNMEIMEESEQDSERARVIETDRVIYIHTYTYVYRQK